MHFELQRPLTRFVGEGLLGLPLWMGECARYLGASARDVFEAREECVTWDW